MAPRRWAPDRLDLIWINGNPQARREMKDFHTLLVLSPRTFNERTGIVIGLPMYNVTNPFALRIDRPGKKTSYVLAHQPKSFDWRARDARPHPMRQAPEDVFSLACRALNQIIEIGA